MKGLFNLKSLTITQVNSILSLATKFKSGYSFSFSGKRIATLFFENSTRTKNSFLMAMLKLGIDYVDVNISTSSVNKGESLYDTVKTLESIGFDAVVIRHSIDKYYQELENINIPIINAGDGKSDHPTQSLLDLFTIYEEFGHFDGLNVTIIGDIAHSRVAHTNAEIMKRLGMNVFISGPDCFMDDTAPQISLDEALKNSDVVMLLRVQFERSAHLDISKEEYNKLYGLDIDKVNRMKNNAIIMHPAPVNRGIELTDEVVECEKSRIFKQMENGVYVRMAVIYKLLKEEL
ncbi:MAG: aspartate carbamoyltransferase catalytic subunit [Acholeplasmatales bacterium]|nr:aspartate carbamoyltransferase catalytic subunit [Acholeplasmatales bacterium]